MIQWDRGYNPKDLKVEEVRYVEEEFKIKFPKEYVECILVNDGVTPEQSSVDFGNNTRTFGLLKCSRIIEVFKSIKDTLPNEGNKIIPMGEDPAGNKYCFDFRKNFNEPSIVFWYHEQAYSEEDFPNWELRGIDIEKKKEEVLHYVCGSFNELLEKLRYPEGYEKRIRPKVHLYEVIKVSDKWGVNFPFVYKALATRHSSEEIEIEIKVNNEIKILDRVLSYEDDEWNIEKVFEDIKNLLPGRVFPIIRESCGGYICLDYRDNMEAPTIVFWNNEYKNSDENIIKIFDNCNQLVDECGFSERWYRQI